MSTVWMSQLESVVWSADQFYSSPENYCCWLDFIISKNFCGPATETGKEYRWHYKTEQMLLHWLFSN